jgi:SAM-dependent methyltransferase
MNASDIIISLNKYKTNEFKTKFLDDTIEYFGNKGKITKIHENECMLTGIRLHMLYNKFYFYLSSKQSFAPSVCYRQLNLSKNQSFNLQNQISGLKKNTFHICNKEKASPLKSFFIISPTTIKEENEFEINEEIALGLIGINSLKFLEYQNLDNYCKIWSKTEKVFKHLSEHKKEIKKLSWQDRDRILISDIAYNFLGTDSFLNNKESWNIIVIPRKNQKTNILLKNKNIIELIETDTAENIYIQWLMYKLPNLVGAPDIYTMLINTKYHFYFMGIKCISIFAAVEKSIYKSNGQSFLDMYLLKIINNLDCFNKLCIKNITFNQVNKKSETQINNNKVIELMYENINKFAKKLYNLDIPISHIKEHFKKCSDKFDTIYKNKVSYIDPLIREQIKIHRKVSNHYITKYGRNKESLLDMGSGKLSSAYIYATANIKNVYGVEPSTYSVQLAQEIAKKNSKTNFTLINAFADKPLNLDAKFDVITFIFTIHYMFKNIDVVINNIKKASKPGTIIIITCVNGDKILEKMGKSNAYEIKYYNGVYWGVYKFNDNMENGQYLFYMKDVYGLEMGSEEYLVPVNQLITTFKQNDIKLIYSNDFKNEYNNTPNSKKIHTFQCDICNMQQILVFEI